MMNSSSDKKENPGTDIFGSLKRLSKYLTKYKIRLSVAVILMLGFSVCIGVMPALMGYVTDIITGNGTPQDLINVILIFILDAIILWICGHFSQRILSDITQEALYSLRTELFNHMQTLSLGFFDRQPIGELMSRVSNDTDVIDQFFSNGIQQTLQSVLTIVVVTLIMLILSPFMTLIVYLGVIAMIIVSSIITRIAGPAFELMQEQLGELNGFVEERVYGQKIIKAYQQQKQSIEKLSERSLKVSHTGGKAEFVALISSPIAGIVQNLQLILVLLVGGLMVIEGDMALGLMVAFLGLASNISAPISQIFSEYVLLINAAAGAGRVFQILDEKPVVADKKEAPEMHQIEGDVRFDHVDFSYIPGRRILKDNTFRALPGQVFGLCGPTGAGKSTIINILTRYYDIENGSISVDRERIDEVKQDSLRIQIAQVLQEPFLFSGTILENLMYARTDATEDECISAAKQAGADEFIMAQPDGYHTILTDGGSNLSQGQKQMLTIARAMVAHPRLLILDEATSNVDTRTEKIIQTGLLSLQDGKTSFIIAHRLSTIRHSDCILVINNGEIVEDGSHDELMNMKGFYYNLYMSQFRGKLEGRITI
jgi:ATP-binding cassette, subfamily B, bacterial